MGATSYAAKKCRKNAGACLLATYVGSTFLDNTLDQKDCILKCLPSNWDEVVDKNDTPLYHDNDGDDDNPLCSSGDCDSVCKERCSDAHPTTVIGVVSESATEIVDGVSETVEDVVGLPSGSVKVIFFATVGFVTVMAALRLYNAVRMTGRARMARMAGMPNAGAYFPPTPLLRPPVAQ